LLWLHSPPEPHSYVQDDRTMIIVWSACVRVTSVFQHMTRTVFLRSRPVQECLLNFPGTEFRYKLADGRKASCNETDGRQELRLLTKQLLSFSAPYPDLPCDTDQQVTPSSGKMAVRVKAPRSAVSRARPSGVMTAIAGNAHCDGTASVTESI
jgi:hypothetical protein